MNFLIIDLNEAAAYEMMFARFIFGDGNNLAECSWNNALCFITIIISHHGVSFATACLSVGKYGPVISI